MEGKVMEGKKGKQVVVFWKRKPSAEARRKICWRFLIRHETVNGESVAWVDDENRADFEATVRAGYLTVRNKPVPPPFARPAGKTEDGSDG